MNKPIKSDLLVSLAALPEDDPRFVAAAAAIAGHPEPERHCLRLLRMGQAAKETGISRCTLWRMIRDGHLKVVEIRKGSTRIPERELLKLVGV